MVHKVTVGVLADMSVHEPRLILAYLGVTLFELYFARFGSLDLSTREDQSGLVAIEQEIIVAG